MKKTRFITLAILLCQINLPAQTAVDALRYSRVFAGGTARYMALNGAYGAVGADFTVLSTNPAGIGLYRSSEFTITPAVFTGNTESSYMGVAYDDARTTFYLGNAGLIFNYPTYSKNKAGWKNVQLGLGINRMNDYNNRMFIKGYNPSNSLLDVYSAYATDYSIPYDQIEQDVDYMYAYDLNPAWWTFLLDTLGGPTSYVNPVIVPGATQTLQYQQWGSMNEFVISIGGNFNDLVYIGGTFAIPWIRYFQESSYVEEFSSSQNDLTRFYYNTELETRASGFSFKFGLIIRPVDWLRIGGAIHTATSYNNIRDYNWISMSSDFKTPDTAGWSGYNKINAWTKYYELTTPLKAMANIAIVIAPYGLISADYEFIDYSDARFHGTAEWINEDIQNGYKATHNFRFGTEWKYDIYSFRAGYAWYPSPYANGINDGSIRSYSGGLGIWLKNYFLDFAYVYSISKEDYYLYGYGEAVAKAENTLKSNRFLFTIGAKL